MKHPRAQLRFWVWPLLERMFGLEVSSACLKLMTLFGKRLIKACKQPCNLS